MSISEKQLLANRKNALNSTGPKTASGKLISSKNALTHGLRSHRVIIEGESRQEYDDFRDQLIGYLSPDGPLEMLLVDRIAAGSWRLRRTGHIESQIFEQMRDSLSAESEQDQDAFFVETPMKDAPDINGSQPVNIVDAISDMKNELQDRPKFFSVLSELEDTFRTIAQHSDRVHIPSLRQYLQDLRQLFRSSPRFAEKHTADLDDAINELLGYEMDIKRQLRPSLGQALSFDLKGPDVLTKFSRYESHIQRGLFKAIHEFHRLQASRQGLQTVVPVAIDVDISGEYIS